MPVHAADSRWSVISSAEDLRPAPSQALIDLMLEAARQAQTITLDHVAARAPNPDQRRWITCWPGEHYRLLAGLVRVLQPSTIIEVGTWQGLGALSLAAELPDGGRVITYDLLPWDQAPDQLLTETDFDGGRIEQRIGDLSDPATFEQELATLRSADFIFSDAPKDGAFEPAFLGLLLPELTDRRRLLALDDIRLLPMLQLWRDLPLAKADATSLGHWSGTGLAFTA